MSRDPEKHSVLTNLPPYAEIFYETGLSGRLYYYTYYYVCLLGTNLARIAKKRSRQVNRFDKNVDEKPR